MSDRLIRGITTGGGARVVAAVTTAVTREAARRHGMQPAATVALARAATAGLLFATLSKSAEERVTLQVIGDGPLGSVTVDADGAGAVRGFVRRPGAAAAWDDGTRARLAPFVGRGIVQVIRDLGLRDQYRGQTALVSGEIDEDLESYLCGSEQVDSALGCDVVLASGAARVAGGVLVQCLPGGDAAAVVAARRRLRAGALFAALAGGAATPEALAGAVLGDARLEVLGDRPVEFRCGCTRDRVAGALALVGDAELRAMLDEDGGAEVTCNFCGQRYRVPPEELARILGAIPRA
jgi:molecular chaperone Hsp33